MHEKEYDLIDDYEEIIENFDSLYDEAVEAEFINYKYNDILLHTFSKRPLIEPFWTADKSLKTENSGTHQVISKEALAVVSGYFPNFFTKTVQYYSDYPDMFEKQQFNAWHYYNE